jgi:hypothetical protein
MKIPILGFTGEPDQSFTVVPQQQLEQMISNLYKLEGGIQTTYGWWKWICSYNILCIIFGDINVNIVEWCV